ncbi:unnamed protein product [Bursaphelenchus xylophilus]|uniref:(pine wood nematode) hypothetical protein n=1 Tax=Bursaphelenchus xylophilus TaxID=6326 RepID=A0A1I7RHW2_BURXY|nr:unnamed protein product [Bursaphelenchus xylophilus]CAG9115329.1 unnamed protein product [Bursaphelenchus xylophilus]
MRRSREPSLTPAEDSAEKRIPGHPRRKWSSALKVVHAMTRFKNLPAKHVVESRRIGTQELSPEGFHEDNYRLQWIRSTPKGIALHFLCDPFPVRPVVLDPPLQVPPFRLRQPSTDSLPLPHPVGYVEFLERMSRRSSLQYPLQSGGLLSGHARPYGPEVGSYQDTVLERALLAESALQRSYRLGSQPSLAAQRRTLLTPGYEPPPPFQPPPPSSYGRPHLPENHPARYHRRSQPSLLCTFEESVMNPDSTLRHSQPMLFTGERIRVEARKSSPMARHTPPGSASPRMHHRPARAMTSNQFGAILQNSYPNSPGSPTMQRRFPVASASERRILKRAPQSDLAYRLQRQHLEGQSSQYPSEYRPDDEEPVVDPIYLALKEAKGKYGSRRGSSNQFDSATPSPQHLSQVSLQDSGYAETTGSRGQLLGSTPQLHQASQPPPGTQANPSGTGRPRAPKLNKQMKSLSLDCAEMPPPVSTQMRSTYRHSENKAVRSARGYASGETSDWGRSVSPKAPSPRKLPAQPVQAGTPPKQVVSTHIVTHDYIPPSCSDPNNGLYIGDRLHIVDNGDPDWLHGFRINDRLQKLLSFPATCVAAIHNNEQPMKLVQNIHIPEAKMRLYRDQVVFAQADSLREDQKVKVRNVRGAFVYCPLQYLMLI